MENLVFTQLSVPEVRLLLRQELESYFNNQIQTGESIPDSLFTIQETAEFLSLAVPTIYGLVSRNEIPYSKKGKRLYFSRLELMDWVKSGRSKTKAEIAAEADDYVAKRKRG